ncbi:hypothetical protein [Synechococcus sp. CBW1108]|uniref:hypothetical protein n=1 Tax=Synechococcus sp. CBW1108 TaxID=1353147 RepID=UPI0018CD00BE|nr:hypothetical protein [Synechococcus sp. CBW1108]QPN69479.1 DNA-binding protein [Synechococcus sp. CBW1108]
MLILLDANVLFTAAHNPRGKAAFLITLGNGGIFKLTTSTYAREEVRRNLECKFPEVLPEFKRLVATICIVPENLSLPCPERLAEKDRSIFRAAYGCKADVLLTGDLRDFGFLMNAPKLASGILIQTVADFLAAIG